MQRYFIDAHQCSSDAIRIEGSDAHHITRVLRMQLGAQVICCDGKGTDLLAEVKAVEGDAVLLRVHKRMTSRGEPAIAVTVAQALPKGDKWEWVLQKGTELGAVSFLPVLTTRTVVKLEAKKADKKRERWQKIVKEAAEQSHRGRIPVVEPVIRWSPLLDLFPTYDRVLFAYEKGGQPLRHVLEESRCERMLIVVGPEGGFTAEEAEQAQAAGAVAITLGSRILRAETAPLALLSCLMYAHGEMGGEPL
ncbi:16S rRNA (uracil(1498)-N(3))-methyltransferase [Desmospora activa]|uniref:Ribosomal RNA small subunit methyltransferase E n=1 Tax=Desmospora activa DSM 45169 TaxID=1121389 RepID=A0A2T4ZC82_9BACL|nr:16S rRNA (uracil(1498)-N(3))-methyltransferase [Desmospora activa]PTM59498.1 16S rRNA (uracil1498-N3)-methyltransferase [Desmospora activa DSM 45169]